MMLLVCLGFKGEYTGSGWELPVAIDANKSAIFSGRASAANLLGDPASREECALYCFNVLTYSASSTTRTETHYLVSAGSNGSNVPTAIIGNTYPTIAAANTAAIAANSAAVLGVDYTLTPVTMEVEVLSSSIAETVYRLTKAVFPDPFGRPNVRTWTYRNKTVSSEITVEPAVTYTSGVRISKIYSDLGLTSGTTDNTAQTVTG